MFTPQCKTESSFTLVELLVVMSIIALLASLGLSGARVAKAYARDSIRDADIYDLRLALESYYEANGFYPKNTDHASEDPCNGDGLSTDHPYPGNAPYCTDDFGHSDWKEEYQNIGMNFMEPLLQEGSLESPIYDPLNIWESDSPRCYLLYNYHTGAVSSSAQKYTLIFGLETRKKYNKSIYGDLISGQLITGCPWGDYYYVEIRHCSGVWKQLDADPELDCDADGNNIEDS